MLSVHAPPTKTPIAVRTLQGDALTDRLPHLENFLVKNHPQALGRHPGWLPVLAKAFGYTPYALEAREGDTTRGYLGLAYVSSMLFGRYLVSLPYLNSGGVVADNDDARKALISAAVALADNLQVRHLELRHEEPLDHPSLTRSMTNKVHMRLQLPDFRGPLWEGFPAKVRNQVRKGEKTGLKVLWGGGELLSDFYGVFSHNMRDLGTPVYSRGLFQSVLDSFPDSAEICVVRLGDKPVAAALVTHGPGITEVPSASSLREFNPTCANMLMYWHMLERAVDRGQAIFDFGRCTLNGPTYRFKKQWGATPVSANWQYYTRGGADPSAVRPDNPFYSRLIRLWQQLPVMLTRWIGPTIVRGIP